MTFPLKKPDLRKGAVAKALYASLIAALEEEMGANALSDLLGRFHRDDLNGALPLLPEEEVERMLTRLGWQEEGERNFYVEVVQSLARETERSQAQISVILRLFASGLYGVCPNGICGETPRCTACPLTEHCAFFNAPPPSVPKKGRELITLLQHKGASTLSNEEIVTLLLKNGKNQKNMEDLSRDLLLRYDGLRGLAKAGFLELTRYAGINDQQAARLISAMELGARVAAEARTLNPQMKSGRDFFNHYHHRLRDLRQEVFLVVLLDQKNRILHDEEVSRGSLTATLIHPREVFSPAIRSSAAAITVLHNHPSGDPTPSEDDRKMTTRLIQAAELLGIRLLDHIVVGDGRFISFVDEGWM